MYFRLIKVNFPFIKGEGKRQKLSFPSTVDKFRYTFRSPQYSFIASYDAKNELKSNISLNISTQANINNMKKTWIGINNLLNRKNKREKIICALKDFKNNNAVSRDPTCIPNILNEHFATVGQKFSTSITFNSVQNVSRIS